MMLDVQASSVGFHITKVWLNGVFSGPRRPPARIFTIDERDGDPRVENRRSRRAFQRVDHNLGCPM